MKKLKSTRLVTKPSKIHGYGVFAGQALARGDLIEECTSIQIQDPSILDVIAQGRHHLCNYIHRINDDIHILLGNGSLYNHSNKPNAELLYNPRLNVMQVWALDTIQRGEEILMYYGDTWSQDNQHRIIKNEDKGSAAKTILRLPMAKTVIVVAAMVLVIKIKLLIG